MNDDDDDASGGGQWWFEWWFGLFCCRWLFPLTISTVDILWNIMTTAADNFFGAPAGIFNLPDPEWKNGWMDDKTKQNLNLFFFLAWNEN